MSGGDKKLLGRWGEAAAADFLRKKGYRIIDSGFRTRLGEIDLIAEDRRFIAFVEVKTRADDSFAPAMEAVNAAKRRRLIATAEYYLATHETSKQPRLDVIEVYAPQGIRTRDPVINHIENAFTGR